MDYDTDVVVMRESLVMAVVVAAAAVLTFLPSAS